MCPIPTKPGSDTKYVGGGSPTRRRWGGGEVGEVGGSTARSMLVAAAPRTLASMSTPPPPLVLLSPRPDHRQPGFISDPHVHTYHGRRFHAPPARIFRLFQRFALLLLAKDRHALLHTTAYDLRLAKKHAPITNPKINISELHAHIHAYLAGRDSSLAGLHEHTADVCL